MSRRPAVDLCIPVWGHAYLSRWLDGVLPSWLSAGNLPALAAAVDLRIVLLTRTGDHEAIAAHPAGRRLLALAATQTVPIDDLVAGDMSAVTLTLAFTRGARLAQARAPDAVAAFLNVDFILGDGSLRALGEAVTAGADIVLAPSLRAVDERLRPLLPVPDGEGAVTLPCGALAGLALAHLHPTAAACFVDQQAITSRDAYEFYHRAGPGLVIARSMQLFPLAVRPGPVPLLAEAFCDYGLFDLFAPGGRTAVLADSRDWFALELGVADQQAAFLADGPHDPAAIAARIAIWSTAPQRAQLDHLVTIRAADAAGEPDPAAVAGLDAFVTALAERVPPPLPIRHHPYWTTGLRRWQEARPDPALPQPPETAGLAPAPPSRGEWLRETVRRILYGRAGVRRAWHVDARLERDLAPLRAALTGATPPRLDDDRLWLARHAGLAAPAGSGVSTHRILCLPGEALDALPAMLAAPGGAERLDLVLTGPPAADREAVLALARQALPGWSVEVRGIGRRADADRRAELESVGRLLWTRQWRGLARLAPRVLAAAVRAALDVSFAGETGWGEAQAVWISARAGKSPQA